MPHAALWQQLAELDGQETARRANCRYLPAAGQYVLTMLGTEYIVETAERNIYPLQAGASQPAGFIEQLCLLAYLINAKEIHPAGRLAKPESLPGGQFFFRGPHKLRTDKLEAVFGDDPAALLTAARRFGATTTEFGDASVELTVLPRLPLTIVLWRGDDEFGPRASVLFDRSAAQQLPLDALWATANLTINKLLQAHR